MNLEKFKQAYVKTISESANDSDLKNWIRSIVEEVIDEAVIPKDLNDKFKTNGTLSVKRTVPNNSNKTGHQTLYLDDKELGTIRRIELSSGRPEWEYWPAKPSQNRKSYGTGDIKISSYYSAVEHLLKLNNIEYIAKKHYDTPSINDNE